MNEMRQLLLFTAFERKVAEQYSFPAQDSWRHLTCISLFCTWKMFLDTGLADVQT